MLTFPTQKCDYRIFSVMWMASE